MKKILAYRFSAFGDVAMTVAVFREFLEQNRDVELIMLSRSNFKDLFEGLPRFIFHGIDLDDFTGIWGINKLTNLLIDRYHPDYVVDLHDVIRSKILNVLFKGKGYPVYKIDKGRKEKKWLTDIKNLNKIPLKSTVERYADVFRKIGYSLVLSHKYNSRYTQEEKVGIGIAPFAKHKGKVLPIEKTYELAKILSETHKIYFFGGGKQEAEILRIWEQQISNTYSVAGQFSLREEIDQIARLKLMISMDSSNMHLSSLAGTRCISVWGATHHYAGFLGYGQSYEDIVHMKNLFCRPCSVFGNKKCYRGDWICLKGIKLEDILSKI